MQHKLIPFNEKLRRDALKEYNILNSGPDEDYDNLTFLAANICHVPVVKISIVDEQRIWNNQFMERRLKKLIGEIHFVIEPFIAKNPYL